VIDGVANRIYALHSHLDAAALCWLRDGLSYLSRYAVPASGVAAEATVPDVEAYYSRFERSRTAQHFFLRLFEQRLSALRRSKKSRFKSRARKNDAAIMQGEPKLSDGRLAEVRIDLGSLLPARLLSGTATPLGGPGC
jgi:hypothetical protein